jgi:H2-forming N5,N10-methylenetetrahydromethanopterin dehydrogenase-like enzyme
MDEEEMVRVARERATKVQKLIDSYVEQVVDEDVPERVAGAELRVRLEALAASTPSEVKQIIHDANWAVSQRRFADAVRH